MKSKNNKFIKRKFPNLKNLQFLDSSMINDLTYIDYIGRLRKIALSVFEWVNLPTSMNSRAIELSLFLNGQCSFLFDKNYGFINTNCASAGKLNIYGLPTKLNCYSYEYQENRNLFTNLEGIPKENIEKIQNKSAILVMNNWERIPTLPTLELFAYRLYDSESTAFTNIKAQKTPVLIVINEKQRVMMENLYNQYEGNRPFIFGDKSQLDENALRSIKTEAPFIADKVMDYKKEIWNEALTFLGINNIMVDKKERLVADEANSNNELINLNLQSYLIPRQEACKQFNELFGLTGTDKEISVRVRSDLHNTIKNALSVVEDFKDINNVEDINIDKEGEENG